MFRDPQSDDNVNAPGSAKVAERPEVHLKWVRFLPGCRGGQAGCLPAEEALPAIHRTALSWFKRYRGFPPALGARGHSFCLGEAATATALPFGFTSLAAFGFVFEVFVVEEVLFSCRKYKVCSAVYTLKNSVLKLRHNLCPVAYQYWWLRRRDFEDGLQSRPGSRRQFYSISRRFFFRLRLRASACLALSFSPGFK